MDRGPYFVPLIQELGSLDLDRNPTRLDESIPPAFPPSANAIEDLVPPPPSNLSDIFHLIIGRLGRRDLFKPKSLKTLRLVNRAHYQLVVGSRPIIEGRGCAGNLDSLWQCTEFLGRMEKLRVSGPWPKYYQHFLSGFRFPTLRELTLVKEEENEWDYYSDDSDDDDDGSTGSTSDGSESYDSEYDSEGSEYDGGSGSGSGAEPAWQVDLSEDIHYRPGRLGRPSQLLRHSHFPALESLTLTGVSSELLESFATLPSWSLKELSLQGRVQSKAVVGTNALVALFHRYPELRNLSMHSLTIIRNPKNNRKLHQDTLPLLETLKMQHVTGFSLLNSGRPFSTALWPHLRKVDLQPDDLQEFFDLADAPWLRNLHSLALHNGYKRCDGQLTGCYAVLQALKGSDLEELSLALWQVNEWYCSELDLPKLKRFHWRQFSPVVASIRFDIGSLAASSLPSLEIIDFESRTTVFNFSPLAGALPSFKRLNLESAVLTPEGTEELFLRVLPALEECCLDIRGDNKVLEETLLPYQDLLECGAPMWPRLRKIKVNFVDAKTLTLMHDDGAVETWFPKSKVIQLLRGAQRAGHLPKLEILEG